MICLHNNAIDFKKKDQEVLCLIKTQASYLAKYEKMI